MIAQHQLTVQERLRRRWSAWGPYALTVFWLVLGYLHYAPGTAYRLSAEAYRQWAFPAFAYSDIIWLWLRDGLGGRPVPYVDYPLEYPPLTGLASWLTSFGGTLPRTFLLTYLLISAATLTTIWALKRIPGASVWYFAATPAIAFYTGHQWDGLAVGVTAVSLALWVNHRRSSGMVGLAAGVSFKLFPLAFVAAALLEELGARRWRSFARLLAISIAVTVAINLPVALANREGWRHFYLWNRDRLADSGFWVLWRDHSTETLTLASLIATAIGGAAIVTIAWRRGSLLAVPLGATLLLWWLAMNKTFTTHLVLWVFLAVALLRPPLWIWIAVVLVDIVGFQLGNYLNLYNVEEFHYAPLIHSAVVNMYDPMQVIRSSVLVICVGYGVLRLWRRTDFVVDITPEPMASTAAGISLSMPLQRRDVWWLGGTALGSLGLAIWATWPLATSPGRLTPPGFDPLLQIWLSRWVQHALSTDPRTLYDANIFHPFPQTLAYTDANIPGALLAWPVDMITRNPVLTNSVMILLSFVIAATGMWLLVRMCTGSRVAAVVVAAAYAVVPFRMIHLWHLNWLQSAWMPWVVCGLLFLLQRPSWRRGVVLGLAITVMVLTSFYFGIQLILLLGVPVMAALIGVPELRTRSTLVSLVVAGLTVLAVAGPIDLPYLRVRDEQGLQRTIDEAERYKAVPASYLTLPTWDTPSPVHRLFGVRSGINDSLTTVGQAPHADGHQHPEIVVEDALYPGVVLLILGVLGIVAYRRRWVVWGFASAGLVAAVLSLGPTLGNSSIPLPYWWMFDHVPLFTAMRVPARLGGIVALVVAVLAGFGICWLQETLRERWPAAQTWLPAVAAAGVTVLAISDVAARPVALDVVDWSADEQAAYGWLAEQPAGAVMEFPAQSIFADPAGASVRRHVGLSMLGSTVHWHPLVNGNSGFIPQSYSDLLERFVGNVPRADGTLALAVSHVDDEVVPLLQDLGVRYLVVHEDRYPKADRAAVLAALDAAAPRATLVERHGDISVWKVVTPIGRRDRPEVRLFAPTLIGPTGEWGPIIAIDAPQTLPSLLSLTKPPTLKAEWFDATGKFITSEGWALDLPVVMEDAHLRCTIAGCTPVAESVSSRDLDVPAFRGWRPEAPGHYVVQLTLSGDHPITCRVDLDVVDSEDEVVKRSADEPARWSECEEGGTVPVNDPGAPPFRMTPPSITFVDETIAVATAITPRDDERLRGWFLLSPVGSLTPWKDPVYQSSVEDVEAPADLPAEFAWGEKIHGVDPGVYRITFWFHRERNGKWQHAWGSAADLAPVVVREDGSLHWAGPIRITRPEVEAPLEPGRRTLLTMNPVGLSELVSCSTRWRMLDGEDREVAAGKSNGCDSVELAVPSSVAPGVYQLQVLVDATTHGTRRISDGYTVGVVVQDASASAPR